MDDSLWHILRVKPGKEDEVALASGVPAYVPKMVVSYFNRRLRKTVRYVSPLLRGFVFLKIVCPSALKLAHTKNVYGFMRNGDRSPALLSEEAFVLLRKVELKAREANDETKKEIERVFAVGQKLLVALTPDKTVQAIVAQLKGNKLIAEICGSGIKVELDSSAAIAT